MLRLSALLAAVTLASCSGEGPGTGTGGGSGSSFVCSVGGSCYSCPSTSAVNICKTDGPGAGNCSTTAITCP